MPDDLAAFLRDRLDDEAETARAAGGRFPDPSDPYRMWSVDPEDTAAVYIGGADHGVGIGVAAHIAYQDPQATLDRVDTLRAVVALHRNDDGDCDVCYFALIEHGSERPGSTYPCPTLRALAYAYRRHEGWRDEWAPDGVEVSG